jgi:predicted dehydrogenase
LASTAVAVPVVVRGAALGKDGNAAPSERVTLGMIGVGRQVCAYNLRRFVRLPDCHVVALCDVDRWRVEVTNDRVARHYDNKGRCGPFGKVDRYIDFREVLDRKDIDAVMVSTPDHWHVPIAVMAAQAGKDVSLEKPIARSIPEGRLLADMMKKYNRVFRMDSEFRAKSTLHRMCALVRAGRIGKVRNITALVPHLKPITPTAEDLKEGPPPAELDYDLWQGPVPEMPYCVARVHLVRDYNRPGWIRTPQYNDGMICNWGAHMNDVVQMGNNSEQTCPVEVKAVYGEFGTGIYSSLHNFEVHYRYADGVEYVLKSGGDSFTFVGEEGTIMAASFGGKVRSDPKSIAESELGPNDPPLPRVSEERDFISCVKSRKRTLVDAEAAQRVSSICHMGLIAIRVGNGVTLRFDAKTERFTNNERANESLKLPEASDKWAYHNILKPEAHHLVKTG